jgi:phosphoribosylformylglycinamidine synthase
MMDRAHQTGAQIDLSPWAGLPLRALLFGEAQGRVVVSTPDPEAILSIARRHGVPAARIGTVRVAGGLLKVKVGERLLDIRVSQLAEDFHEAIPRIMQRSASAQDVALVSDSVV